MWKMLFTVKLYITERLVSNLKIPAFSVDLSKVGFRTSDCGLSNVILVNNSVLFCILFYFISGKNAKDNPSLFKLLIA